MCLIYWLIMLADFKMEKINLEVQLVFCMPQTTVNDS